MSYLLGLDIGTTSTVGLLIRPPDLTLALASRPVTLHTPHPGWAEEDPEEWWSNVCSIIPDLLLQSGVAPEEIDAVGVTGMLPTVVLLDSEGCLLRRSIQQSDGRCGAQVAEIRDEVCESEFLDKTGNGVNQQLVTAKLRWIEANEPDVFARIDTVFGSYNYINWRLTGRRTVEENWALEAGFVDVRKRQLSDDLIALSHLARSAIPPMVRCHERLGVVGDDGARQTGLAAGTPVVGGAADHVASAFAAGIVAPGDVLLKFGGAIDILTAADKVVPDARMYLDYHVVPDLYMPNGCMASGGSALNWFIDVFAAATKDIAAGAGLSPHAHLDRLAEAAPAGANGVQIVPYFLGEKTPIHDPNARAIITGLSLNHGLAETWRALLEGFAYALRHHVEVLNDMGHPAGRFVASDGGAKSPIWMQIVADVLQRPVQLLDGHDGSCLGAAWIAAIGAGLTGNWSGIERFVRLGKKVLPRPENAVVYDAGYGRFRATYKALADHPGGRGK